MSEETCTLWESSFEVSCDLAQSIEQLSIVGPLLVMILIGILIYVVIDAIE